MLGKVGELGRQDFNAGTTDPEEAILLEGSACAENVAQHRHEVCFGTHSCRAR
ncbi:MAG TPA: hypothetical protein VMV09_05760 [Candidatus Saccharimonadales bacterium]|nr:hypothetical protein [Candidatus Saccharimonadales bacterium]